VKLSLEALVAALGRIAPLELAESWDNVGLLLDPRAPGSELEVSRVLLSIDATPEVVGECKKLGADCLVAYHPPFFAAKRRYSNAADTALFSAITTPFAIYSPHTALDAAAGGLNDWLAKCLGPGDVTPLVPARGAGTDEHKLVVFVPEEHADRLRAALSDAGAGVIGAYSSCSFNLRGEGTFFGSEQANPRVGEKGKLERVPELRLEMVCPARALAEVTRALFREHPYEEPAWDLYPLAPKPDLHAGVARRVSFPEPRPLLEIVAELKRNLGLERVRVATSKAHQAGKKLRNAAVAAGSGGAAFDRGTDCDLYVTGELRHHDVLSKLARGSSVVLCEHSSSERGYLPELARRLIAETGVAIEVAIAQTDVEPLRFV
jgi:dinuclear metal center YbgI/SA1388 family protein